QRHAQVQQPGPLDVHGDAVSREHIRRRPRRLVGERGGRVPRREVRGEDRGEDLYLGRRRLHRRRARSRSPHQVTSKSSSSAIFNDILEWPRTRSVNTIGTSEIRPPHRCTRYAVSIWNPYPLARVVEKSIAFRVSPRYVRYPEVASLVPVPSTA